MTRLQVNPGTAESDEDLVATNHGRAVGVLKDKIGPQSASAWDFPEDLTDIMEGKAEG